MNIPQEYKLTDTRKQYDRQKQVECNREFRKRHPESASIYTKKYRTKCRYEAIKYYSNGTMCCACCGENHYEFLSIDHINGGGDLMRRTLGHGNISQWLKSRDFPSGYRVLCHNCNMSLGFYGYCPHKKEKIPDAAVAAAMPLIEKRAREETTFEILEWFRNYIRQLEKHYPNPTNDEKGWLGNMWDMVKMAGKEPLGQSLRESK